MRRVRKDHIVASVRVERYVSRENGVGDVGGVSLEFGISGMAARHVVEDVQRV